MEPKIICRLCGWEGDRSLLIANEEDLLGCPTCDHVEFQTKRKNNNGT